MEISRTAAERTAKALRNFGIKKMNGLPPTIDKCLKKENTGISNGNITGTGTRELEGFFNTIGKINELIQWVRENATSEKYKKLCVIQNMYDYIDVMMTVETPPDGWPCEVKTGKVLKAAEATTEENKEILEKLKQIHSSGSTHPFIKAIKELDNNGQTGIFKSARKREFYDYYLKAEKSGLMDDIKALKVLSVRHLTSVQLSANVLARLRSGLGLTREETVYAFNTLLELKSSDQYIDAENEDTFLVCANCGTVNAQSSDQLSSLYTKKKVPECNICKEKLLTSCPNCKKWMIRGAKKHICGWNAEINQSVLACERAIEHKNATYAERCFERIEESDHGNKKLPELRRKIDELIRDRQEKILTIRTLLEEARFEEAELKLKEAEEGYAENETFAALREKMQNGIKEIRKATAKKEIEDLIEAGQLNEAKEKIQQAEQLGFGSELDIYRIRVDQMSKSRKVNAYIKKIDECLEKEDPDGAAAVLSEAVTNNLGLELVAYRNRIEEKSDQRKMRQEQALRDFGEGHFGNYTNGMKKITHILDWCPDCQQAKVWLADNPRKEQVVNPRIQFKHGERTCTITWEDDDSFTSYIVRRAEKRYPRDLTDGVEVCTATVNRSVTDTLPEDQPGIMWQYSIFAVRNLDGQWVKTDCPGEAVWLPDPQGVRIRNAKNAKGEPVVELKWEKPVYGCEGVKILRCCAGDVYTETMLDITNKKAQTDCVFVDEEDIESQSVYRYTLKQVWKNGNKPYMSAGHIEEIKVD